MYFSARWTVVLVWLCDCVTLDLRSNPPQKLYVQNVFYVQNSAVLHYEESD